jgi:hypothetical protein
VNGGDWVGWFFYALVAACIGVDACVATSLLHSKRSLIDVKNDYNREFWLAHDGRDADAPTVLRSVELFQRRGAA